MTTLVQGLTSRRPGAVPDLGRRLGFVVVAGGWLTLEDKQAVNRALLKSGAAIDEMNCVRKHLSAIKGGRLAALCAPAQVVTLLISDVPGDAPEIIASGPTVPDSTTCADALAILARYGIDLPEAARRGLESGTYETPKPGDPRFAGHRVHMIATPQQSLEAAAAVCPRRRPAGACPQRRDGGRVARSGQGACGARPRRGPPRGSVRPSLRDPERWRDDGDGEGQGPAGVVGRLNS